MDLRNRPAFRNRAHAGQVLAEKLERYAGRSDVMVLGLPRGGVPVAFEVAGALGAPLDVFLVRKLGVPGQPELAMGAVASGGVRVLNDEVIELLKIPNALIDKVEAAERDELARREQRYRGDRPAPELRGRTVILIDDGLATGSTVRAAVAALRTQGLGRLVLAVPIAPRETCEALGKEVDQIVCALMPEPFQAVGLWYDDFSQTTDEEVRDLLVRSTHASPSAAVRG